MVITCRRFISECFGDLLSSGKEGKKQRQKSAAMETHWKPLLTLLGNSEEGMSLLALSELAQDGHAFIILDLLVADCRLPKKSVTLIRQLFLS